MIVKSKVDVFKIQAILVVFSQDVALFKRQSLLLRQQLVA